MLDNERKRQVQSLKNKNIIIRILACFFVVFSAFFIILIVNTASWKDGKTDNMYVYYNNFSRICVAGTYSWDGNTDDMTVIIPDKYENMKINSLGGYYGTGVPVLFFVEIPKKLHPTVTSVTESEECIGGTEKAVTYNFTVKLGKNIKYLENFCYKEYYEDGDNDVVYIIEYNYECSEDNKWYYSKDGKLYNKSTDELMF